DSRRLSEPDPAPARAIQNLGYCTPITGPAEDAEGNGPQAEVDGVGSTEGGPTTILVPQERRADLRVLIDECLHSTMALFARKRGHEAYHVNWLGLSGNTDWNLMSRIVDGDFIFVTNNARDFRRLYAREPLHAGLVIIEPQVTPVIQVQL